MKLNVNAIERIISRLLHTTSMQLDKVQKAKCPHYIDIDIECLDDKYYVYNEQEIKSKNRIFKIPDTNILKRGESRSITFSGPMLNFVNSGMLRPFIIFIDNVFINPNDIYIHTDIKNTYLEIQNLNNIKFTLGNDIPEVCNGYYKVMLPKIPDQFKEYMILGIDSSNIETIENICLNNVPINLQNISDIKEIIHSDSSNILEFNCNDSIILDIIFNSIRDVFIPIEDIKMVLLPDDTIFNLDNKNINDNTFIFKSGLLYNDSIYGLSNLKPSCITIDIPYQDNTIEFHNSLPDEKFITLPQYPEYKIFPDMMFIFHDGYPITDYINHNLNTFEMYNNMNIWYRGWYYEENYSNDNIIRYNQLADLLTKILDGNMPEHVEQIIDPFNFDFDRNILQQDRIKNIVEEICNYNTYLLQEYIDIHSNVEVKGYTYDQIIELSDYKEGIYSMKFQIYFDDINEIRFIVFKNGLLYDMNNIRMDYQYIYIDIPEDELDEDDYFEFMKFKKVCMREIKLNIDPNNNEYLLANYIPYEDMLLLTHTIDNHIYKYIPVSKDLQYEIQSDMTDLGKGYVEINLSDYYHNREVSLYSKRMFVHSKYIITGNEDMIKELYTINLPSEFKYCTNRNQFLVFLNGRKIHNSDTFFCLNKWNLPFDKRFLHITKKCKIGDILDIFYVPEEMNEIYLLDNISDDGYIEIDKSKLGYNFDGINSSIFINGRRLPDPDIVHICSDTVRIIKDTRSIKNISILQHIPYKDYVFEVISSISSIWDIMIKSINKPELDDLFNFDLILTDTEENIKSNSYTKEMVLYDIVRRYWLIIEKKMKEENPAFYVGNYEDQSVAVINSSIEAFNIIDYIIDHMDTTDDHIVIDAEEGLLEYDKFNKPEYIDITHLLEEFNFIDASIIMPYFFYNYICINKDLIGNIPIDPSMEQIEDLPPLY